MEAITSDQMLAAIDRLNDKIERLESLIITNMSVSSSLPMPKFVDSSRAAAITSINQAEIAVILGNMRLKTAVTYSLLVSFFIILIFLLLMMTGCIPSKWESQAILASLETVLGYTMYPLVRHFFPSLKAAEDKNII